MLEGLMQHDYPLTLQHLLDRMRRLYAQDGTVVSVQGDTKTSMGYGEIVERVEKLAAALDELGVEQGDRVATFAWNIREHLEVYLAVPCMGAVLHTLNVRLFAEQLTYIVNHAEDKVILVEDSLIPVLEELAPTFETVEHYIVIGDGDTGNLPNAHRYEELLDAQDPGYAFPDLDDRQAAGLCYTSGTTGNPKGVLYSHRSNILHAMGQCMTDSIGIRSDDRVLPVVPMFHANAWGLPYGSIFTGADLVLPGANLKPDALSELIADEKVTLSGAVPTIWMDLLRYADEDENDTDLSSLRLVICGGSAVPLTLMQELQERHDVQIIQAWGMTETSPLGSVAWPPKDTTGEDHWRYRSTAGRPGPLVEARLIDDDNNEVPWDGKSTGELEVRGPWIASEYFRDDESADKFNDGWLRTGDIAAIDERGYIMLSDRSKDVIKSGGEWVSSVELENQIMAHPAVLEAAVIAMPHERYSERPLACVVLEEDQSLTMDELKEHLTDRVAKWWIPDELAIIDAVPKTSVGKFDKKVLRKDLEEGRLTPEGEPAHC